MTYLRLHFSVWWDAYSMVLSTVNILGIFFFLGGFLVKEKIIIIIMFVDIFIVL